MAICNITVTNDADFYRVFQYMMASGTPIDITGWRLFMMLRRHAKDEAAVMKLDTETGEIVIVDGLTGKFSVRIAQEELERLQLGDFDHSLVGEVASYKRNIWTGTLTNNAGPSR